MTNLVDVDNMNFCDTIGYTEKRDSVLSGYHPVYPVLYQYKQLYKIIVWINNLRFILFFCIIKSNEGGNSHV